MKTANALRIEARAFGDEIAARGDDYTLTDEDRGKMAQFRTDIDAAVEFEENLAAARSGSVEGTPTPITGDPHSRVTRGAEDQPDEIDKRIDGFIARGANFDDRIQVRAALTTASLFGGEANPTKDDRGFKATVEAPLTFLDLFPSTSTNDDLISYVREVPTENTAAETAEGQTKPEASFRLEEVTHGMSMVANWITITRQALRSRSLLRSAVEGRLTANVRARANKQMWVGDGVGANIEGLRNSGITTFTMEGDFATKGENVYRTVKRAKRIAAQSLVPATHVVINPEDNESLEAFLELASGRYNVGLTIVESNDQPAGSVVVGALSNAAVLEIIYRDGMEVYASREHSDNLTKNLVTILGEQEAGLAVYKPAAVVEGTFAPEPVEDPEV